MKKRSETKLKTGTLVYLQDYIKEKIKQRGFADESLHERLLLLAEEVGELINACRHISGMNVDKKRKAANKVGEEVADVINMVFAVGIALGLNIEKEFFSKERRIDGRTYKRSSVLKRKSS